MENIFIYSFIITFIWFGFVTAISFMEAPVKFKAPSLTRAIGLDVGRFVFKALNRIEIVFSVLILISILVIQYSFSAKIIFAVILVILILQTFWLLPELTRRAVSYIKKIEPPKSKIHIIYIVLEIIKIISLFWLGILQIGIFRKMAL